ncbi:carbohydrate-binding protein [Cohnella algarum]|uniref:carbohydrate-binding protein n=1 Tax=Cohnella algarum TaxID=2044859 RepID=UPI0023DDA433|nr:carbohydrate-binding protein [Cohnella algarum]
MGGKTEMAKELQHFFDIGEYVAINEPDLHVPYLFNYLGYPYLTQYYVREYTTEVVTQKYHNHGAYAYPIEARVYRADPEGYLPSMDDDAGAMASWFVYGAMGLYPGNPGTPIFLIGSPIFDELTLHLDGGKTFTIKANNVSSDNRFIQSASLNGQNFDQAWISYADIMAGGTLAFEMGDTPNTSWGAAESAAPPTTEYADDIDGSLERKELIASESTWKYYDKGQYAGDGWTSPSFDDSAWASGAAPLGYDNTGYAKTRVSFGANANNKYPTTYFRKTFEASDTEGLLQLEAELVRDDGAVVYLNGNEVIRSNLPSGTIGYDTLANVTVNDERNAVAYQIDPSYLVEGTNVLAVEVHQANATSSDIAFDLRLEAVKPMEKPDAPTGPVVDDKANTFGWTAVPGFEQPADYEFSTDGGKTWKPVAANPQTVGPLDFEAGQVQVRVKADESRGRTFGRALASDVAYTSDIQWDVYDLKADVDRTGNMEVSVTGTLKGDYADSAYAVFQLMDGGNRAWMTTSFPVEKGGFELTQIYNVNADKFKVNIYLVDAFNGNVYESLWLAEPVVTEPETEPAPGEKPPVKEEPLPEPLPVPEKEPLPPLGPIDPEEPVDPEEPEEPGSGTPGTLEFESYTEWTSAVNGFNNNPLKTEGGNGGTVVANTFDGAWLAYADVDLGDEGANYFEVEYVGNSTRVPADAALELRLGSPDGEGVGTVELPATGSDWSTYKTAGVQLSRTLTGTQTLYVVLKGSTTGALPYIGNFDRMTLSYREIRTDYAKLELETYDEWSTGVNQYNNQPLKTEGGKSGQQIANTYTGAWLAYMHMDFGREGVNKFAIEYSGNSGRVAADAAVEVRLGSPEGMLVGKVNTPATASSWGTYATAEIDLAQTLTGVQDIYLVLTGTTDSAYPYIGNFDNASFSLSEPVRTDYAKLELESYDEWSGGALKTEGGKSGLQIAGTYDGAWLAYERMDFGGEGVDTLAIEYSGNSGRVAADAAVEVRLGSPDGERVGMVSTPPTASSWGTYATATGKLTEPLTGVQDIYLVLTGTTDTNHPYIGNYDNAAFALSEPDLVVEFEDRTEWTTAVNTFNNQPLKTESNNGGTTVGNTFAGAWMTYANLDFGTSGKNRVEIVYDAPTSRTPADVVAEIRLNDKDGELVGTVSLPNTGSGWGTYRTASADLLRTLSGTQTICVVFKGSTDSSLRYVGNLDKLTFAK